MTERTETWDLDELAAALDAQGVTTIVHALEDWLPDSVGPRPPELPHNASDEAIDALMCWESAAQRAIDETYVAVEVTGRVGLGATYVPIGRAAE